MYMIAGHVAEVIGGKKYEELVKEKLFTPLGMNASIFLSDATSRDEHIRTLNLMEHFVFRKMISSFIGNDQSAIHITSKQENN